MTTAITNAEHLEDSIWEVIHNTPAIDMASGLSPSTCFSEGNWGIDAILTSAEMVEELFRIAPVPADEWEAMSRAEKADYVWNFLFIENSPISEGCRSVLTTLGMLDNIELDPGSRDLNRYRAWFAEQSPEAHFDHILNRANLSAVVMQVDPFDPEEYDWWQERGEEELDSRIRISLDLSSLVTDWKMAATNLKTWGIIKKTSCDKSNRKAAAEFISNWCDLTGAVSLTINMGEGFSPAAKNNSGRIIKDCVLKTAESVELPVVLNPALIAGSTKKTNIALESAVPVDFAEVETLCNKYSSIEFFLSTGDEREQEELNRTARHCFNLTPFGLPKHNCGPKAVRSILSSRFELLGITSVPLASGAEIPEQLLSRWAHGRWNLGRCLQKEYLRLWRTGWRPTVQELERDIAALLNDNFWAATICVEEIEEAEEAQTETVLEVCEGEVEEPVKPLEAETEECCSEECAEA